MGFVCGFPLADKLMFSRTECALCQSLYPLTISFVNALRSLPSSTRNRRWSNLFFIKSKFSSPICPAVLGKGVDQHYWHHLALVIEAIIGCQLSWPRQAHILMDWQVLICPFVINMVLTRRWYRSLSIKSASVDPSFKLVFCMVKSKQMP